MSVCGSSNTDKKEDQRTGNTGTQNPIERL